ncbi:hypothetical protein U732_116 [Clostridium argentinense CDC 2741]|uniref:Uncharacterized protein n=2 Tax=Clostridium argentinense TaxID=29341 RepID=A0A0C1R288_9CLOT|nr:hypothetical protein [Clostridium argentinense]KIE44571.1 hypothetical protein U732_116 [Clostridium argentinense CDC 2741]BBB39305.1 hypothetical protein [Clostridium argentinense]
MKKITKITLIFSIILITLTLGFCAMWVERDKTTNIRDYNEYFGDSGKHRQKHDKSFGNNSKNTDDIFPKNIPDSAKVENFYYYYYNPFDPNFVSYLVYTCSDEDFIKETERLSKIDSSKDYLIYGATGFNYPVSAVYANESGYTYALADKENKKLIYVEINFCNYFTDINYEKIINEKYLPINFDAKKGNSTQKKKHEEFMKTQEKNR